MDNGKRIYLYLKALKKKTDDNGYLRFTPKQRRRVKKKAGRASKA